MIFYNHEHFRFILVHRTGAHLGRGPAQRTGSAGWLDALQAVGATWAGLTASIGSQLLAGTALIATLLARRGLRGASGLSQATQLTAEGSLVGLIESMAAGAAQTRLRVEVLAGWATLLAVSR